MNSDYRNLLSKFFYRMKPQLIGRVLDYDGSRGTEVSGEVLWKA